MNTTKRGYIAKGTDGCVLKPALVCGKNEEVNDEVVGKVYYDSRTFHHEMLVYKLIRHIDARMKWSLPILTTCKVSVKDVPRQCNHQSRKDTAMQAVMMYGGVPLDDYIKCGVPTVLTKRLFIRIMKTLLYAIYRLQQYGYAHMDIKPSNILIKDNRSVLIDFGMVTTLDNIYNITEHINLMKSQYIWYPPEFFLYSMLNENLSLNVNNERTIESIAEYCLPIYSSKCSTHGFVYNQRTLTKAVTSFKTFIKHVLTSKDIDFGKYSETFDIYSCGVVFMSLYEKQHQRWDEDFNNHIYKFLLRMIESNPIKRISVHEALKTVNRFP